jgi:periplasmic protein TonB
VFDEVTKKEGGKAAARRAGYVFGSTVFQGVLIAAIITASAAIKAKVIDEPVVDVKFVKTAPPPPPPPPPPAPPAARKRPPDSKPRTELPKPPPPQALIQPQEIKPEMKAPDPNEPPEPEYDYGDAAEGEGVIGGVVGARPGNEIEDAPAYATAGYRKPQMAEPGCVQRSVRMPPQLAGFISGPITVKFAIRPNGQPDRFEVMGSVPDQRIANAIWQAVQSCRWVPGADAQGKPVAIWVILPVRFTSS